MFALAVSLSACVDTITVDTAHLVMLLYVPFVIFVVNELMEEQTSKNLMHVAVLLGSCCFVEVYLYVWESTWQLRQIQRDRSVPLYVLPEPVIEMTEPNTII